jgi:hypothetical protein
MLVLLIEGIDDLRRWDGFMWHDILTKFHEDGTGIQAILRFYPRNLRGCNVGITDGRDF